jgi:phosphohistidine phosphatase SixA
MHIAQIYLLRTAVFLMLLPFLYPTGWTAATGRQEEEKLLNDFRAGNHVVLMRHALAPGIGDPEDFSLNDCTTQRNLSDTGREQAARIGSKLKEAGITEADIYTSQWCRCRETAALLSLGTPKDLPSLNSFFREAGRRLQQTEELQSWLTAQPLTRPLILVTHQVNITAFSSVFPQSGEIVVMRRDEDNRFQVAGTIRTD